MKKVNFTLFENIDETCAIIDIGTLTIDIVNRGGGKSYAGVIHRQNIKPDFSKGTRQQRRKIERSEAKNSVNNI